MVLGEYATIPAFRGPTEKSFTSFERRKNSFNDCQKHSINSSLFAEAGFFFIGGVDTLRCFCCGIVLENWEEEDNPWIEHAKVEMDCPHLYLNKGWEFIQAARNGRAIERTMPSFQLAFPKCIICYEKERGVGFYPCEHTVTCRLCAATCSEFPLCQTRIRFAFRVNIP